MIRFLLYDSMIRFYLDNLHLVIYIYIESKLDYDKYELSNRFCSK